MASAHGSRYRLPSTSSAIAAGVQNWASTIASTGKPSVHPCVLVADLDCLPALDVAYKPSRFEHNPRIGLLCRAGAVGLLGGAATGSQPVFGCDTRD
jgi:hypothetical protein